jgi:hypothetical protein
MKNTVLRSAGRMGTTHALSQKLQRQTSLLRQREENQLAFWTATQKSRAALPHKKSKRKNKQTEKRARESTSWAHRHQDPSEFALGWPCDNTRSHRKKSVDPSGRTQEQISVQHSSTEMKKDEIINLGGNWEQAPATIQTWPATRTWYGPSDQGAVNRTQIRFLHSRSKDKELEQH